MLKLEYNRLHPPAPIAESHIADSHILGCEETPAYDKGSPQPCLGGAMAFMAPCPGRCNVPGMIQSGIKEDHGDLGCCCHVAGAMIKRLIYVRKLWKLVAGASSTSPSKLTGHSSSLLYPVLKYFLLEYRISPPCQHHQAQESWQDTSEACAHEEASKKGCQRQACGCQDKNSEQHLFIEATYEADCCGASPGLLVACT